MGGACLPGEPSSPSPALRVGIDPKRVTPHGDGPLAPVAANITDEGRAKNRRVELVAQP